jgi:hypothetical protein
MPTYETKGTRFEYLAVISLSQCLERTSLLRANIAIYPDKHITNYPILPSGYQLGRHNDFIYTLMERLSKEC